MKIALFGSTGRIGKRILTEALARGHQVTAIVRDAAHANSKAPNLEFKTGDVLKPESIAAATKGSDVVISAYGPGAGDAAQIVTAAKSLLEGVGINQPMRLIVLGGAGSLEVAPGLQLVDTPDFPAHKKTALSHREALGVILNSPFNWTFVSPPFDLFDGTRTESYRVGTDQLLVDQDGKSRISVEDYAKAVIDEVEKPQFLRQRFTVGY